MISFFIIEDNCKISIKDSSSLIIPDQFVSFVNKLFKNDIEVIFFISGSLGNVMLNDGRLNEGYIRLDLERLNTEVGGKSIQAGADLLLPEYKGDNICYVCYDKSVSHGIHTLFHELAHFEDPFACNIQYSDETEEGTYIRTDEFIQNIIQIMLNDYYAEYRSFYIIIQLKVEKVLKGLNLISLVEVYNRLINDCYDNFNKKLSEIEFFNHFNFQIEMIKYSKDYFFKYFFGFLGMWRAFKESNFNTDFLNTKWNDAVGLVKAFNNDSLGDILKQIEDKILINQYLDLFQNRGKMFNSVFELFLEYYKKDFLKLIY